GLEMATTSFSAAGAVPKRIVEADDDDAPEKPAAKSPPAIKASKSSDSQPAGRRHGKRKAVDGNNDEIATLDPLDLPVEPRSSVEAISPLRSKAARLKSKSQKKPTSAELA